MTNKELKIKYSAIVRKYIRAFEVKHKIEFSFWLNDEEGGTAIFANRISYTFEEIKKDIDGEY